MPGKLIYTAYTLKNNSSTNPLHKLPRILKKNLEQNLCVCNEVLKIDIINAILNGATTVEEIKTDLCNNGKRLLHSTGKALD